MTRNTTLSSSEIASFAARGRQLHGRAVRGAFSDLAAWFVRIATESFGRRATVRLGCSDCGAQV